MNWFTNLWKMFWNFTAPIRAALIDIGKTTAIKIFAEFKAELLKQVGLSQAMGGTGEEKFNRVFEAMKKKVGEVPASALNCAIELAVSRFKESN